MEQAIVPRWWSAHLLGALLEAGVNLLFARGLKTLVMKECPPPTAVLLTPESATSRSTPMHLIAMARIGIAWSIASTSYHPRGKSEWSWPEECDPRIQHPRTPDDVRAAFAPQIFNLQPGLNSSQWDTRRRVQAILQGNAKPDKHKADASHLSEAAETGCAYFITHDKRILDKSLELATVLPPTLTIVTLAEFMEIFDGYAGVDG